MINSEKEELVALNYNNSVTKVEYLTANEGLPDPLTFLNGESVKSSIDWKERSKEIAAMYQYYMYGVLPDKASEEVGYKINNDEMIITVKNNGRLVSFPVTVNVPDKEKVPMPSGGYPVLLSFLKINQVEYANDRGYAVVTIETKHIAADNSSREGVFYQLYPYGEHWTEQTGVLMAWAWGAYKVIDALEAGAASALNIDSQNVILTGVSRWGKAATLAGAIDKRIKVTAPSCSGAGGIASFRYKSEGKIYDYSSIGITEPYKVNTNEPLGSLQSPDERHWFNDNFTKFKSIDYLPFDQHFLAALCGSDDRYLFITGSYINEDWVNPTGMWATFLEAKQVYDFLGISDHIAFHYHKEGHMVTDEDMVYLLDYCDHHFYGKSVASDLSELHKSLYLEPANYDKFFDRFIKALLIIGGSGFVSSHLAKKALEYGYDVWVLTRGNRPVPAGVIPLIADRSDTSAFKKAIQEAGVKWDAVLDCICMNAADARLDIEVLSNFTKQIIVISTDIVYQPSARRFPQTEECDGWLTEGYAGNKRMCELEFMNSDTGTMKWTILRPGHIFGPGSQLGCLPQHQRDPELLQKILTHKPISLVGGGHFLLHPIFVTDLCELMLNLVGNEKAYDQIFCVGGPDVIECRKYYEIIASILKTTILIEDIPAKAFLPTHPEAVSSVCHRIYDLSKLRATGVKMPETPIEEGLKLHVKSMLE